MRGFISSISGKVKTPVIILESEVKVKVGSVLDVVMYSLNQSTGEAKADRAL